MVFCARLRAWFLAALAALALARPASAVRVAFVGDTGVGNSDPAWGWTDWQGVRRGEYKVNGELCRNFKGEPCRGYSRARDVIAAAKDNGAELIVHAGDLDYESAPKMWRLFVEETIRGAGMDFVAAKGNHDMDGFDGVSKLWSDPVNGYAAQLQGLKPGECFGKYGVDMTCDFAGVTIVLSDVGVDRAGESANKQQYAQIDKALRESTNKWKICVWHMNQEAMQVSYKGDAVGWGVYEICRKHGAFIVNGHAHTYSRTKEMSRFGTAPYGFTNKDLQIAPAVRDGTQPTNVIHLSSGEDGSTGVAALGFGGYKNEPQLTTAPHWAKIFSSSCLRGDPVCEQASESNKYGTLMCDFGDSDTAECWVVTTVKKDATRREKRAAYRNPVDRFFLVNGKPGTEVNVAASDETALGSIKYDDPSEESFLKEDPSEDYSTDDDYTANGRKLSAAPRVSEKKRPNPKRHRRKFDGDLNRNDCVDRQPPEHGCVQQSKWGKCDAEFMVTAGLCAKTCGRCVDTTRGEPRDYDDDYVEVRVDEQDFAAAEKETDAPAPSVLDDVDFAAIADDVLLSLDEDSLADVVNRYEDSFETIA